MRRAKREAIIDDAAGPCVRCSKQRAEYTCSGGVAKRTCVGCRQAESVDVAVDVPRRVKSLEDWRWWWGRMDARR